MTITNKKQMIAALTARLQARVQEKHLKVVAFAQVETWTGQEHTIVEHLVVRDRPSITEEHHHCLVFENGGLSVTEINCTLTEALALHADKLTPSAKFTVLRKP